MGLLHELKLGLNSILVNIKFIICFILKKDFLLVEAFLLGLFVGPLADISITRNSRLFIISLCCRCLMLELRYRKISTSSLFDQAINLDHLSAY